MMNDIRLLSGKGEVYEAFGKEQVGSSAMPYKKNPITCEKICSLARYVINQETVMNQTYINQWLERSLDDKGQPRKDKLMIRRLPMKGKNRFGHTMNYISYKSLAPKSYLANLLKKLNREGLKSKK